MRSTAEELCEHESAYDYIVVGAGSAGCIMAARLAEDSDRQVLLVEAGARPRGLAARMPAMAGINFLKPTYNWSYRTVAQRELLERRIFVAAGRALGGSSAINAMCYMRGHPTDYDDWAQAGLTGWSYAEVLPYFKRSEAYRSGGDPRYRGHDGPFATVKAVPQGALHEAFLAAGADDPAGSSDDPNGYKQEGFFTCDFAIRRGARESAASAYLRSRRPNLRILLGTTVRRLLLEHGRAVGVELASRGRPRQVRADGEVILSAGAVRSPQLLMLSGVGPADHLRALGLPVALDLPAVGANLEDHVEAQVTYRCKRPVSHSRFMRPDRKLAAGLRWLASRDGICATTGFDVGALVRSSHAARRPDLQVFFYPALLDGALPDRRNHGFGLGMNANRCRSRGRIRLASVDPEVPPLIDPAYLREPADLDLMVEAVARARDIAAAGSFDGLRGEELEPGPAIRSPSQVTQWIRRSLAGNWHLAGTCRMGRPDRAVTDGAGAVYGIDRLRVVDASSMPGIVNANPAASVMMIAERISDIVRARPALPPEPAPYHIAGEPGPPS